MRRPKPEVPPRRSPAEDFESLEVSFYLQIVSDWITVTSESNYTEIRQHTENILTGYITNMHS